MFNRATYRSDFLKDRVALITGGGTGICRGIALAFAAHGCDVAITSRKAEHLEPTAAELRALGVRAVAHAADVRNPVAVNAAAFRHESSADRIVGQFARVDPQHVVQVGLHRIGRSLDPIGGAIEAD